MLDYQSLKEYDDHYKVVRIEDESVGLKGYICIHRKRGNNPSLGATRIWHYESEEEALADALRLSYLMSHKSALAGLPYGGAKAALMMTGKMQENREKFFEIYAQKVNELNGEFVTGCDVGVSNEDVDVMKKNSQYIIGDGVDSGFYTALGVLYSIKSALKHTFGTDAIQGRTFAIQGLGKTGGWLLELLHEEGAIIYATDIDQEILDTIKMKYGDIIIVDTSEIHKQKVDVFSPCALNHIINEKTLKELDCKIIVGSANNQLEDIKLADQLKDKGILYVPDYIANSGGIISVVDKYIYKNHVDQRVQNSVHHIYDVLEDAFAVAGREDGTVSSVTDEIAEAIYNSDS